MDKIVKVLLLLSFFMASCSKRTNYDENVNNIKFVIEKYITIDLKKEKIFLDYYGLKYEDTIIFTEEEKNKIFFFYNKYNLNSKQQEFWYIDENSVSASLHDEIIIFNNDKIKSRFIINSNHDINNSFFEKDEDKMVAYRNFVKKFIKKKHSYKKANDSLKVFVKRKLVQLM